MVLFERTDTKDVSPFQIIISCFKHNHTHSHASMCYMQHGVSRRDLEKIDYSIGRHPEFRYKTEFQSHEPEVSLNFYFA